MTTANQILDITDASLAPPLERMEPSDPIEGAKPMPRPVQTALYDADGHLTREGMLQVIRNGGSVGVWVDVQIPGAEEGATRRVHKNIWRAQDIPDELALAGQDPVKRQLALDKMEQRKADLDRRIKQAKAQDATKAQDAAKPPAGTNTPPTT